MTTSDLLIDDLLARQRRGKRRRFVQAMALVAVVVVSAAYSGLLDPVRLAQGLPAIWQLATDMVPPNFTRWSEWWRPLLDTIAMSIAGTALAVVLSVPLGLLAARNTTPNVVVYRLARVLLNGLRAVPELIMAIIFVAAVGFGSLPGVLALGLHSVGMVAKFFAEAIEHADPAPIEAADATGASRLQVIIHAVLPQVLPQLVDVTVYRWEYNFRASTVLGMVGAGGIGFELIAALRIMHYREVFALFLVVLAMVMIVDGIGAAARRHLS